MPSKVKLGVLVECDPSIKAIIIKINAEHAHDIIIEDIDDEHVLIKSTRHEDLKQLLKDVSIALPPHFHLADLLHRRSRTQSEKRKTALSPTKCSIASRTRYAEVSRYISHG